MVLVFTWAASEQVRVKSHSCLRLQLKHNVLQVLVSPLDETFTLFGGPAGFLSSQIFVVLI